MGGHEIMSCKMANVLADSLNYDVFFIFFHKKFAENLSPNIKNIQSKVKTHTPLPFINNIIHLKDIFIVKKQFKELSPDYIVNCQGTIELGLTGLFAAKLLGIKSITYIPIVFDFAKMRGSYIHKVRDVINNKFFFKIAEQFIVPSMDQKKILSDKNPSAKIKIIHNPIESNVLEKHGFRKRRKTKTLHIGVIGRLQFNHKNFILLINVAKKLIEKGFKTFKFDIIGDGEDIKIIHRIKKEKIGSYFTFYGWLSADEIKKLLCDKIDLVVLPSRFESSPSLTLLELVMSEFPLLVSDIPAFFDYIPKNFRFSCYDKNDLSNKLIQVYLGKVDFSAIKYKKKHIAQQHSQKVFVYNVENFSRISHDISIRNICNFILWGRVLLDNFWVYGRRHEPNCSMVAISCGNDYRSFFSHINAP